MAIPSLITAIAELTGRLDPSDLPGLVELQERLEELAAAADTEAGLEPAAGPSREAASIAEEIVLRTVSDELEAIERLRAQVAEVTRLAGGADGEPRRLVADDDVDEDILAAWIAGCRDAIGSLEQNVVALEAAEHGSDEAGELLAEVRRTVHTIKGEAGFLSLDPVRDLCHEAESMIDDAQDADAPFPAEEILALVDWLGRVLEALNDDAHALAPEWQSLRQRIVSRRATLAAGETAPVPASADADANADAVDAAEAAASSAPADDAEGAAESAADADADANDADADAAFADTEPVSYPDDLGMDENMGDFILEAREHLASAEEALLELEGDPENGEIINTVFRAFHTIKGVAGFMNLHPIVELAHDAETMLDKARNGELLLDRGCMDLVLQSCDMLGQLIAMFEGGTAPTRGAHAWMKAALQARVAGETPPPGAPEGLGASTAGEQAPAATTADAARPTDGDAPSDRSAPATPATSAAPAAPANAGAPARPAAGGGNPARRVRADQTVKVNTTRLDGLVTMVGELVIAQQMVIQDPQVQDLDGQRVQRNLSQVSKIIRDLQEVSMALRMVPVRGAFQKMARLVRDISAKAGKKIEFVMEGEDTELDRNVVEEIGDPLVHMVRNACDHGIEGPEERVGNGKEPTGTLTLRAYHQGGSIVIEIADDGRGLDREKIGRKALERGLVASEAEAAELSDYEIQNMIFAPGFSTAEKITDISGRGVGMDVVRKNIEALRGKVEIFSEPGKGSTFKMRLPLTMAIIDGMVVRVGEERYVVPTLSIEQSFRPTKDELHTTVQRGEMASVRGDLLPIYRLKRIFDLDTGVDDLTEGLLLVLESNDRRFCLQVDDILGQQQVVIKSLGEGVQAIRGVAGGAILGDGRVALIMDVGGIVQQATDAPAGDDVREDSSAPKAAPSLAASPDENEDAAEAVPDAA